MSSQSSTPDCSIMKEFATSQELHISLSINLGLAALSVPILIKSIVYVATSDVFHVNTRLQILVHLAALFLHSFGRVALHSIDLFNYLGNWDDACEILPDFYRCLILRGCYNVGLALSSMCSIALVVERIAAYSNTGKYEHCKAYFGLSLVFLQILLAAGYLFSMYYYAAFAPGNFTLYYCQTIATSAGSIWFIVGPFYAVMVAQILSRVLFKVLLLKSKNLRAVGTLTLSNRFNLDQSIRSLNSLKLLVNYNTLVYIVMAIVSTTLNLNSDKLSKPRYLALVEAVHALPLYGIAVSIGVYSRLQTIDNNRTQNLTRAIETKSDYYFSHFRKQMQ